MAMNANMGCAMGSMLPGGSGAGIGSMNPFKAIGAAADTITNVLPQASEMSGDAGGVSAGLDAAYDGISDAAMSIMPVGTMIGGIMKAGKLVGRALNALGAGTDGMCVCAGTKVFTSTGKLINIEDLQLEEGVIGWDPISKSTKSLIIAHLITPTIKDCIEIKLQHGQILRCSVDHPILSDISPKAKLKNINGKRLGIRLWEFRRADLLKIGQFVGLANNIDIWGTENLDLAYQTGGNKTLPENIHKFNKHSVCELLAGLFDYAGSINSKIVLYLTNKKLLESVKYLLQKLGIFSTISKRPASTPRINGKKRFSRESYRLAICDKESVINFYNQIKLRISHKQVNLNKLYSRVMSKPIKEHRSLSGAKQSKIIDIVHIGKLTVYNLQANNDHTYLANGIITHNTTQDAVLGSPFFNLTPFGLINGIFGKKADTFTKDNEVFSQMGAAYGGSDSLADLAVRKSGKKYGLFSMGALAEANRLIDEAERLQDTIRDILEDVNNLNLLSASMSQIKNQAYANRLQGGYLQGLIRAAKLGAILENKDAINRAKAFLKNGAKFKAWPKNITKDKEFIKFLETCPKEILEYGEDSEYLYDLWRTGGKPTTLQDANDSVIPFFTINDETGKLVINDNLKLYTLLMNDDSFTFGTQSEESEVDEDANEELQSFKEGGQLNVIPEGALHAHKHNLEDIDESLKGNITHKGIPVVSIDEDGNVEQLAEVERNELILNLETTEAIEELRKEWHDEESPSKKDKLAEEAGKIFAKSVIENTDDRTNLMESV